MAEGLKRFLRLPKKSKSKQKVGVQIASAGWIEVDVGPGKLVDVCVSQRVLQEETLEVSQAREESFGKSLFCWGVCKYGVHSCLWERADLQPLVFQFVDSVGKVC